MRIRLQTVFLLLVAIAAHLSAEPGNLGLLKQRVTEYMESPDYFAEIAPVAHAAAEYVAARAATRAEGERLAVVVDIDETVLSNYPHMRDTDFGYHDGRWDAWIDEARCPAIVPMLEFHKAARANGVAVLFLTGRRESTRKATARNLIEAGFGGFDALRLKPDDLQDPTSVFKAREREQFAAAGWTIIACIGDQASDLEGGNTGRTFKIPNPAYFIK